MSSTHVVRVKQLYVNEKWLFVRQETKFLCDFRSKELKYIKILYKNYVDYLCAN